MAAPVVKVELLGAPVRATGESRAETRASRHADAVLAEALVPEFKTLSLDSALQLLQSDDLLRRFEEAQRRLLEQDADRQEAIASTLAATGGLSIGYVVWLVRGGVLVSSMVSALPAWQMVDPLPVVAASGAGIKSRKFARTDDPDVERLFDDQRRTVEADPPPALQAQERDRLESCR